MWCGWTGFKQERAPAVASDAGEGILCTGGALGAGAVGWAHSERGEITDFLGTTRFVKTHRGYQGYWKTSYLTHNNDPQQHHQTIHNNTGPSNTFATAESEFPVVGVAAVERCRARVAGGARDSAVVDSDQWLAE